MNIPLTVRDIQAIDPSFPIQFSFTLKSILWIEVVLCSFKNNCIYLFCVCGCFAFMYVCALCACSAQGGRKRALDSLALEVHKIVSCHMSAGNQTRVLGRAASVLNH